MMLKHFTVVNTRPTQQAIALNNALKTLGAHIINLPMLDIKAIHLPQAKKWHQQFKKFHIAIFVSANSVHCSHDTWSLSFPVSIVIAIGTGTAHALKEYGISKVILPNQFNSQGILALPELAMPKDKKIVIFCGKNSKPLLKQSLIQKGALVRVYECYERFSPLHDKNSLSLLDHSLLDAIISTSYESLNNLNTLLKNRSSIKKTPLIVISHQMEYYAKSQGWSKIWVASNATNNAIIETIKKLKSNQ